MVYSSFTDHEHYISDNCISISTCEPIVCLVFWESRASYKTGGRGKLYILWGIYSTDV